MDKSPVFGDVILRKATMSPDNLTASDTVFVPASQKRNLRSVRNAKLSDKSIKMLATYSASSAFCALFCTLSAQPDIVVGINLWPPRVLEDDGVKDVSALKDFTFMDLYTY